jgi:hypothetical protein
MTPNNYAFRSLSYVRTEAQFYLFLTKDIIFLQSAACFVLICLKLLKTWHFALILTAQHQFVAFLYQSIFPNFPLLDLRR